MIILGRRERGREEVWRREGKERGGIFTDEEQTRTFFSYLFE